MIEVSSDPGTVASNSTQTVSTIVWALIPRLPNVRTNRPWKRPPTGIARAGHEVAWAPVAWGLVANVLRRVLRKTAPTPDDENEAPFRWTEETLRAEVLAVATDDHFRTQHGIKDLSDEFTVLMADAMTKTLLVDAAVEGARVALDQIGYQLSNGPCPGDDKRRCLIICRL